MSPTLRLTGTPLMGAPSPPGKRESCKRKGTKTLLDFELYGSKGNTQSWKLHRPLASYFTVFQSCCPLPIQATHSCGSHIITGNLSVGAKGPWWLPTFLVILQDSDSMDLHGDLESPSPTPRSGTGLLEHTLYYLHSLVHLAHTHAAIAYGALEARAQCDYRQALSSSLSSAVPTQLSLPGLLHISLRNKAVKKAWGFSAASQHCLAACFAPSLYLQCQLPTVPLPPFPVPCLVPFLSAFIFPPNPPCLSCSTFLSMHSPCLSSCCSCLLPW